MAKQEWGVKRSCPKCSAKFYDLNKNPAECPACHAKFDPEQQVKKRVKRKPARSLDDAKARTALAAAKKKADKSEDGDDIELPEFEDLSIIEDIDDMEALGEVEAISTKPVTAEEDVDEEEFLKDDSLISEEDEDEDDK
ncbi:MAG: TIGR02300 family protein [Alphaproteobacteria bacterium]|nr:TIGR02300 family protein [Alphaproteobacteria bacterium]